jgi:hypothetical protein
MKMFVFIFIDFKIFALCETRNNVPQQPLKNEGDLSGILKIPCFPKALGKKPKNPKLLNPHGKCLTSQDFTLQRQKAEKEAQDKFNEEVEKRHARTARTKARKDEKIKRTALAKSKKDDKIQNQLRKKGNGPAKRRAFVTPLLVLKND